MFSPNLEQKLKLGLLCKKIVNAILRFTTKSLSSPQSLLSMSMRNILKIRVKAIKELTRSKCKKFLISSYDLFLCFANISAMIRLCCGKII